MKKFLRPLLLIVIVIGTIFVLTPEVRASAKNNNFLTDFKVSKKVLYKGNGVSISLNGAKQDKDKLRIEFYVKNSSKKNYAISAHEYAINNLMAGGKTYGSDISVPSGKKAKFFVEVKKEWFEDNKIKTFKKFDVMFWAYSDNMKEWESGKVSFSTNKDNKKGYYKPQGKQVYADENVSVNYILGKNDEYKFCLKNKTNMERRWSIKNCSVNGWAYDLGSSKYDLYSIPILDGCYAVFDLKVDNKFKKEDSIKTVKKIEFNVIYEGTFDDDNNHIEEISSEVISVKVK